MTTQPHNILVADNDPALHGLAPYLELGKGAQQGMMPINHMWDSSAGYTKQKLRTVLVQPPLAMRYMDNPEMQVARLRNLIEALPTVVEGWNAGIELEFKESIVGNAGEMHHTVTKSTRTISTPTFTWPEKFNAAIANYWEYYIRYLIMDPDISCPAIIGNAQYLADNSPAMTPEMQSFSVLAFEPDQTHTRIVRAWFTTNMMPKRTGEIIGKREMQGSLEAEDVNIEFTGTTREGRGVNEFAVRYLKSLAMKDVRPYDMRAAYTEIDSDLTDSQESFKRQITEAVLA
jgi:hypothetical protein